MSQETVTPDAYRIADALRSRILSGGFRAGEHLRQEKLAAEFGVSRLPIRAALAMLTQEGLLQHSLNRGMFVRTVTARDLANIHEVRLVLERIALPLAAERRTEDDLAAAREQVALMQQRAAAGDVAGTAAAALDLRRIILSSAHNEAVMLALAAVDHRLQQLLVTTGELSSLVDFTVRLVDRLEEQDPAGAVAELEEHLERVRQHQRSLVLQSEDNDEPESVTAFGAVGDPDEDGDEDNTEEIIAEVRGDILTGRLSAGARISERMISDAKGVTRIAAHSVISALVAQGLVSPSGPRSAARVRRITKEGILDILAVRTELSVLTARLASERASAAALSDMHAAVRQLESAGRSDRPEKAQAARVLIPKIAAEVTNNPVLKTANEAVRWPLYFPGVVTFTGEAAVAAGSTLYRAIAFRDADLAEKVVRDVFSQITKNIAGKDIGG